MTKSIKKLQIICSMNFLQSKIILLAGMQKLREDDPNSIQCEAINTNLNYQFSIYFYFRNSSNYSCYQSTISIAKFHDFESILTYDSMLVMSRPKNYPINFQSIPIFKFSIISYPVIQSKNKINISCNMSFFSF